MSHLDTAFKLGAVQAEFDFNAELQKQADMFGGRTPGGAQIESPASPSGNLGGINQGRTTPSAVGATGTRRIDASNQARQDAEFPSPRPAAAAMPRMQLSQPTMGAGARSPAGGALSPGSLSMGGMGAGAPGGTQLSMGGGMGMGRRG